MSDVLTTDNWEAFRSNHFELIVDNKDYLRLSCEKVDYKVTELKCTILASFYLNDQTRTLLDSCLYWTNTEHAIELKLYSPDNSKVVVPYKGTMKIVKKHTYCDMNSNGGILLIDVLFVNKLSHKRMIND